MKEMPRAVPDIAVRARGKVRFEGIAPLRSYLAIDAVGGNVACWGHVGMFTPWSMNVSEPMARHLRAAGHPVPDDGTWYHFALTRDAGGRLRMWVNGVSPPAVTTPVGGLAVLIVGPNTVPVFPCPLRSASLVPPINGQNPTSPLVTEPGAALI